MHADHQSVMENDPSFSKPSLYPHWSMIMLRPLLFGAILYTTTACSAIENHLGQAAEPGNSTEIIVEIPKGTTAGSLGSILAKAGVIDSADNFKNYIRLTTF